MKRVQGWRNRVTSALDSIRLAPFVWGDHDCLSGLVVPVLHATYDHDFFARYVGEYKTAKGGLGVMHRAGFENLADLVASELIEVHPSRCVFGDIVAVPSGDEYGFALGVVNGDRVFVMLKNSLGTRPFSDAVRAFKAGE